MMVHVFRRSLKSCEVDRVSFHPQPCHAHRLSELAPQDKEVYAVLFRFIIPFEGALPTQKQHLFDDVSGSRATVLLCFPAKGLNMSKLTVRRLHQSVSGWDNYAPTAMAFRSISRGNWPSSRAPHRRRAAKMVKILGFAKTAEAKTPSCHDCWCILVFGLVLAGKGR